MSANMPFNMFDPLYPNFDARGQELLDFGGVVSADLELSHFLVARGHAPAAALIAHRNLCRRELELTLTYFAKAHFILIALLGDQDDNLDRYGVFTLVTRTMIEWERRARSEDRAHMHVQRFLGYVRRQLLMKGLIQHRFTRFRHEMNNVPDADFEQLQQEAEENQAMEQPTPGQQIIGHPSGRPDETVTFTSRVSENWVRPSTPIPEPERLEQRRRARETMAEALERIGREEEGREVEDQAAEVEIQRELRKNAKLVKEFEAKEAQEAQEAQLEEEFQDFLDKEHRQGRFGSTREHFEIERKYLNHALNQEAGGVVLTREQWLHEYGAQLNKLREFQEAQMMQERLQALMANGQAQRGNNLHATPNQLPQNPYAPGHQVQGRVPNAPMSTDYALKENNLHDPSTKVDHNIYLMKQHGGGQQAQDTPLDQAQAMRGQGSHAQYLSPRDAATPSAPGPQQTPVQGYQAPQNAFSFNQGKQVQVTQPHPYGTTPGHTDGGVQGHQTSHGAPKNSPTINPGQGFGNVSYGTPAGRQAVPGQGYQAPFQAPQNPPASMHGQQAQSFTPMYGAPAAGRQAGPGQVHHARFQTPRNPHINMQGGQQVQASRTPMNRSSSGNLLSSFWGDFKLLSYPRTIAECQALEDEGEGFDALSNSRTIAHQEEAEAPESSSSEEDYVEVEPMDASITGASGKQTGGVQAPRKILPLKNKGKARAL